MRVGGKMTDTGKAGNLAYDFIFLAEGHVGAGRHRLDVQKSNIVNIAKVGF